MQADAGLIADIAIACGVELQQSTEPIESDKPDNTPKLDYVDLGTDGDKLMHIKAIAKSIGYRVHKL